MIDGWESDASMFISSNDVTGKPSSTWEDFNSFMITFSKVPSLRARDTIP